MNVTMKLKGVDELLASIDKANFREREALDRTLNKATARIQFHAKQFCPVDTGRLRNSIHKEKLGESAYLVETNVHYSVFQEFGSSRNRPQPFFRPALDIVEHELPVIAEAEFRDFE